MAIHYNPSDLNWKPIGVEYFNLDRGNVDTNALVVSGTYIDCPALSGVTDIIINHDTIFYLTNKRVGNSIFTNEITIDTELLSGVPLSANTYDIGSSSDSSFVSYYYCNSNNPQFNKTVDVNTREASVNLNYVLFSPFKSNFRNYKVDPNDPFSDTINTFLFNMFSLKNYMTPTYDYDSSVGTSVRTYNNIFLGSNQRSGYQNMFLGYTSNLEEFRFIQNDTTYFHYPLNASISALSASTLINRGAKAGDSPMNSDIISVDQFGYSNYTASGPNQKNNGEFLCAWLSGENNCGCDSVWVERWYDPDTVSQGDAYIQSKKLSGECGYIWDVPSSMNLIPGVRYYYDRYGADRNEASLNSINDLLSLYITNWTTSIYDTTERNVGYIVPNYTGESTTLVLDGNTYAQLPPADFILQRDEISVSIDVYKENWCCGRNSQLLGNYHFGGWGIFYNTGIPNNILTLGDDSGNLYSFNIEGTRIFEKYTEDNPRLHNISFDWITTDLNGARWVLDSYNNKILKLDVDDILVEVVNFPPSYNVNKIQISRDNKIYFLDINSKNVFVHDEIGTYVETITASPTTTIFEIQSNGDVWLDTGDLVSINSYGDVYKSWGSNLYKNDIVLFNFNDKVMDFKIDSKDNIWVVYDGNKLAKIDKDDSMLFNKPTLEFLENDKSVYIGLIRKSRNLGCDEDMAWIVYGDNRFLVEVDSDGIIHDVENTSKLVLTKSCDNYTLRANGDFTGYDVHRKFEIAGGETISYDNPAISLKIKLEDICGNTILKYINVPACKLSNGWHNFGFTYGKTSGDIKLFIDGAIADTITVDSNKWAINYNRVSPIIIGGNSGKLGSENQEKSIIDGQYFVGIVGDVRIYTKEIPEFLFQSIFDSSGELYEDLIWNVETQTKSYIESVDKFFMNKKPGHKSRKFNIKIKGLNVDDDLKLLVEESIVGSVDTVIPKYTQLNSIVWE